MSTIQIPFGVGNVAKFEVVGKDDTGTIRGLQNIKAVLDDTTDAYIADGGGGGFFYVVPRQNVSGGTPLSAQVTVNVSINADDPVLGGHLPAVSYSCDLLVPPPPPPHTTNIFLQRVDIVAAPTIPTDPGSASITVTP